MARCLHRAKTWQRESVAAEISSPGAHGESAKTAFFIRRTHIRRPGAAVGFPAHVFICFQIEYSIYSSLERTNPAAVKPLQKTKKTNNSRLRLSADAVLDCNALAACPRWFKTREAGLQKATQSRYDVILTAIRLRRLRSPNNPHFIIGLWLKHRPGIVQNLQVPGSYLLSLPFLESEVLQDLFSMRATRSCSLYTLLFLMLLSRPKPNKSGLTDPHFTAMQQNM